MITSKQRAFLRSIASTEDTIFQLGKEGVSENFVKQLDLALEKREIIKFRVLDTAFLNIRETAEELAVKTRSNLVQVIGKKIVLYRPASKPESRKIILPR